MWRKSLFYQTIMLSVNIIGIRFTKWKAEEPHYNSIIEHVLRVEDNEIYDISSMGPKKFML